MAAREQEIRQRFRQRRIPFADHSGQADRFRRPDFGFGEAAAQTLRGHGAMRRTGVAYDYSRGGQKSPAPLASRCNS